MTALDRVLLRVLSLPRRRRLVGPVAGHPESVTADLGRAVEDELAALDRVLWPRGARWGRLRAAYTLTGGAS